MYWSIILFCITITDTIYTNENVEKRLLLSDPDIILSRLNALEQTVKSQADEIKQQSNEIKQQADKIQQQTSEIQQQSSEIQQQTNEIQQQTSEIQKLKMESTTLIGATYIRWGRKQCPDNQTEMVYSGFAGGGSHDQTGAASEYVCLSPDPVFDKTSGPDYGRIYGSEFEGNFWASDSHDEDVPCALCRTNYATTVMIPGTKHCYDGWHREYYGYLASGSWGHIAASSFVCVDFQPEYLNSGVGDMNGKLFYSVIAKCGSLPCPPYKQDHPVMCVVCSK